MKKLFLSFICITIVMMMGVLKVGATPTTTIDPDNNITMPDYLYSDKATEVSITGLTSPTVLYQLVNVTDNEDMVEYVDALATKKIQYAELSKKYNEETDSEKKEALAAELTTVNTNIESDKNHIKELVEDFDDTKWSATSNNSIPSSLLTEKDYYVVWVKATAEEEDYHDYWVYQAQNSSDIQEAKEASNPDTGIENTLLYIGVSALIVIGSYLVMNKNKERYE